MVRVGSPELASAAVHVGLNLVFLTPGEQGGMETYARELIPELTRAAPEHRFTAFVNLDAAGSPGPWSERTETVVVGVRARNRLEWVRGEQLLLPRLARRAGIDLLHSFASTAPASGAFRRVVTIHDLIYRIVPQAHPGIRSLGMRVLVPLAARTSDRIIAVSASTKRDLETFLRVPARKIDVVPHGVGISQHAEALPPAEVRALLDADERPIVLSVSAKLAHKNLRRLIAAVGRIPAEERPLLVLPGYATKHEEELKAVAARLGVAEDVRFLGWISDEQLEGLYAAASCCVLPSLAEGFGLPVLEAMARSVPVACSGRGALGEVAGDAALLFDPESEAEMAGAIERLLRDPSEAGRLVERGRERVAKFSWSAAAAGTLGAYERALSPDP